MKERNMIRKASAALIALLTVVGFNILAVSPAQAVGSSVLWNQTDKCATPEGNSLDNGTVITVWSCTGSDLQKWHWDGFLLVNDASGKCMTPRGNASDANGAVLTLWTCDPYAIPSPQRFNYEADHIWTLHGTKCITSEGNSLDNGTWLTLWTCGTPNNDPQSWQIVG